MDSFTRVYTEYGIKETSVEVAVLPCDRKRGAFSAPRDSGAIVGMLTGGGGTTEETDLRVSSANKRTVLLTAAHVTRPPPVFANTGMSRRRNSHSVEEIIALGDKGYSKAITSMLSAIGDLASSIDIWGDNIARLPEPAEGEEGDEETTGKRQEYLDLVDKAKKKIEKVNKLHSDVTRFRTTPAHAPM